MAEKLDFSLPEKKTRGSAAGVLTVLLLVLLIGLVAANLYVATNGPPEAADTTRPGLSPDQVKQLATKLAQRDLPTQAAAAWQDYLAGADLTETERARALFHAATMLEQAGRYEEAIDHYYRSELTAELSDLNSQIDAHVKQCFEMLGKFAALRYELMDRTSIDPSQAAGGKVVAEIGPEKITEGRLDALLEQSIENQLAPMEAFMTPEQLAEQKKQMLAQTRTPQGRQEFLRGWLAQEILYREALDRELSEKPEVKQVIDEVVRGVLSQQLMNEQLAASINITDTDLQTYYAANKARYIEPASARISHIRVADEDEAKAVLASLETGADFAELASELSLDESTKGKGGRIATDVAKGSYVPGIGDANEINAAIFAAEAPVVLQTPFETEQGWEVVKVDQKHPARQMSFDEVRQQVMMELLQRKRQDVQREYIDRMMDKYNVIVHTAAFEPIDPNDSQSDSSSP